MTLEDYEATEKPLPGGRLAGIQRLTFGRARIYVHPRGIAFNNDLW